MILDKLAFLATTDIHILDATAIFSFRLLSHSFMISLFSFDSIFFVSLPFTFAYKCIFLSFDVSNKRMNNLQSSTSGIQRKSTKEKHCHTETITDTDSNALSPRRGCINQQKSTLYNECVIVHNPMPTFGVYYDF